MPLKALSTFRPTGPRQYVPSKGGYQDQFLDYAWEERKVRVHSPHRDWTYKSRRGVGHQSDGVVLAPYFYDKRQSVPINRPKVCMVKQYRIAVDSETYEFAGGIANEQVPGMGIERECNDEAVARYAMAREFKEEFGLKVDPKKIKVVFCEYPMPSFSSAKMWGGVVRIEPPEVLKVGEVFNELNITDYTVSEVFDLAEVLSARRDGEIRFDFATSRLLDELVREIARECGGPHFRGVLFDDF